MTETPAIAAVTKPAVSTAVFEVFGGRRRKFQLRIGELEELERITGSYIGAIHVRLCTHEFGVKDLREVIRLGLEGGGASQVDADALMLRYCSDEVPLVEHLALAVKIVTARMNGVPPEEADGKKGQLEPSGASGISPAITEPPPKPASDPSK